MLRRAFLTAAGAAAWAAPKPARILVVHGPSAHPPGTHEVAAGARLVAHCLNQAKNVRNVQATATGEWPTDAATLNALSAVVFIGDVFPPVRMPDSPRILADLENLMRRGAGLVCLHFATGLQAKDLPPNGDHPLLRWMGGYFSTGGATHHKSVAKVFPAVTITPAAPAHPISRGWRAFTQDEEPYYNNYFGPDANRLAPNVTALATAMLPPEQPKSEIVAWCVERPDGGRGCGMVMPHFYRNWRSGDFRRFAMNAIVWTAKLPVPKRGVETDPPDLAAFQPESIEPIPRKKN